MQNKRTAGRPRKIDITPVVIEEVEYIQKIKDPSQLSVIINFKGELPEIDIIGDMSIRQMTNLQNALIPTLDLRFP